MRKYGLLPIIFILLIVLASGCDIFQNSPKSITPVSVGVGGIPIEAARSSWGSEPASVEKVWVRVFDSTGEQVTVTGASGTDGAAVLTWNESKSRFTGSFDLDGSPSGTLTFHAMAFNASGEIIFQGTTNTAEFGSSTVDIIAVEGYSAGDRGPGGGWIFYDKGSFGDDSQMGGKSWRYLETAFSDMVTEWVDVKKIDGTVVKILDGNVVDKTTNDIIISKHDYYWGPADSRSTSAAVKEGYDNTDILDGDGVDGITTATPNIVKATGRPAKGDADNTRRDTALLLTTSESNAYSDWFIPSKTELGLMLSALVNGGTRSDWNFEEQCYWSSTEDSDGNAATGDNPEDAYWAWAVDFDSGASTTDVNAMRSEAYRVRPVRAF